MVSATVPLNTERAIEYVNENAGTTHTYTTPASDNDVVIRWGYMEEADRVMNGNHVHIWLAVMDGNSGQKKRITKRMAYQRLTSALRMCEMDIVDIPYLAPLANRQAYEKYIDKTNIGDDETSWKTGGITNVAYLRKVVEEVGNDLYRIYRKIHQDTGLPLQKIVSQRAGITAYLDMTKTIRKGSIKKRIINQNSTGVTMIVDNIIKNTELRTNPSKRIVSNDAVVHGDRRPSCRRRHQGATPMEYGGGNRKVQHTKDDSGRDEEGDGHRRRGRRGQRLSGGRERLCSRRHYH